MGDGLAQHCFISHSSGLFHAGWLRFGLYQLQLQPGNSLYGIGERRSSTLVSINDHTGQPLAVTRVTLTNGGLSNSLFFCGDQTARFPLGATVKIEFTSGIDCMAIVDVVILSDHAMM